MQVKNDDRYVKELSRLSGYNLNFEFLGHGNDFTQQMTVRFASGELPDLIRTDSSTRRCTRERWRRAFSRILHR